MFHRLAKPLLSNSFFLFGARGTGKTMLIEHLFKNTRHLAFDLLDDTTARRFRKDPSSLKSLFAATKQGKKGWVVLDEVQRVPKILNTVHQMIEKEKIYFALTGSSARKLKRGGANLLAGRAFVYHLFPLTFMELGNRFDLKQVMAFGSLPKLYSLKTDVEKKKYLQAYALTYVKEEIVAEQIVRSLDPFQDFLQVSAQMNGKIMGARSLFN